MFSTEDPYICDLPRTPEICSFRIDEDQNLRVLAPSERIEADTDTQSLSTHHSHLGDGHSGTDIESGYSKFTY